jgi:hypothetical protein
VPNGASLYSDGIPAAEDERRGHPFKELARGVGEGLVAALKKQYGGQKSGFPRPEDHELGDFGRAGFGKCGAASSGDVFNLEDVEAAASCLGEKGGDVFLASRVVPTEMEYRRLGIVEVSGPADFVRQGTVLWGYPAWHDFGLEERFEAVVEVVDADKIMQDAFVDTEGRGGKAVAGFDGDELKTAQRCTGSKRAPMRVTEGGEGQGKGDGGAMLAAEAAAAEVGESGIHLNACAEEEDISFKGGKLERLAQYIDGWWGIHGHSYFAEPVIQLCSGYFRGCVRIGEGWPGATGGGLCQRVAQTSEFQNQVVLVSLGPVGRLG